MVAALRRGISWLTGYRGVPFTSRLTFRFELWHILAWSVASGIFHPGFAALVAKKSLGAHDMIVAAIAASLAFANIMTVWWGSWARHRSKKLMLMLPASVAALVAGSVWLTPMSPYPALLLCAQVVLFYVCASAVITIRSTIWRVNYPRTHRAQIAGRFTIWSAVLIVLTVLLAAWYLDGNIAVGPPQERKVLLHLSWIPGAGTLTAYRNVYPIGAAFIALAVWLYHRVPIRDGRKRLIIAAVPTPPVATGGVTAVTARIVHRSVGPLVAALGVLRRDAAFRDYMVWQFISGSATMMVQVPLVLILAERFEVNYLLGANALVNVPFAVMLLVVPVWSRWFDQTNISRFRSRQMLFWAISRGVLAVGVAARNVPVVLVAMAISGIGMGGGRLAWLLGHMQFARRRDDALYMGIHVSLTGIRGMVMPFVGMWLYRQVFGYHIIWLTGLVILASVLAFWKMARTWERAAGANGQATVTPAASGAAKPSVAGSAGS